MTILQILRKADQPHRWSGTILYRYDANNNCTNVVEGGKTNSWTFDAYDRVSSYRDSEGNLIQYRMDASGNVTNMIYPGNRVVTYAYDSLNRLTDVWDWRASSNHTTIEYDLGNRVRKITRPNGTIREMNYDAAGQTTNVWERTASGVPIALFKLNWNSAALMEWEFAAPLPHAYTPPTRTMYYNEDNQLTNFNGSAVGNDADGNMTNGPLTNNTLVSNTYDARNRLLSAGGLNYAYDPSGNRIAITNGANVTRFVINSNAGSVYGTQVHTAFAQEIRAFGNANLRAEVSFMNGAEVRYGTAGSVRLDAVQFGGNGQVLSVFDLKTGSATLTPQRILQIQQQVGSPVPVNLLRP